ncbi:phage head spike fiber domain-containing protein [Aeromonas caviae]|uniref:phage head spike fiber domain-containing protein n=1 Tax=Aeromonas caviae TaxID=648 RepID=UPI003F74258D
MAGLWQRTGNVTVTNGSKTITGFGTKWKTGTLPIQKGHTFYGPDNAAYEVDTVVSDENILLVDAYRGGTLANQPYRIDITRTSTISQFAADLASLVAKYRSWFDGMMTWLTGSGDVAILNPDTGANVTIPSWKKVASEGEGQAARAKTEADKAAASAALAGDIVVASALPLPDVWAPLSDSLRLITGYGRDVLVGSDVVARMVNFSRNSTATYIGKDGQLKTAAVNEPRFEKEGLLIEGQSTNLVPWSDDIDKFIKVSCTVSNGVITGSATDASQTRIEYANVIPVGVSGYTITAEYDPSQSMGIVQLRIGDNESGWVEGSTPATAEDPSRKMVRTITSDGWVRVSVTSKLASATSAIRINFAAKGAAPGSVPTVGLTAKVRRVQVEALPFASSYIPTAGAAVTRAAEVCWIPMAGNSNNRMSFAMTFSGFKPIAPGATSRALWYETDASGPYVGIRYRDGEILAAHGAIATGTAYASGLSGLPAAVIAISPGVKSRAGQYTATQKADSATLQISSGNLHIGSFRTVGQELWGHVRNLRIWHRSLTEDQIKAVA